MGTTFKFSFECTECGRAFKDEQVVEIISDLAYCGACARDLEAELMMEPFDEEESNVSEG